MGTNFLFNKFIGTLLVICLGLLSPFVYLQSHSPHILSSQGYQLALFQGTDHRQLAQALHRLKPIRNLSFSTVYQANGTPQLTSRSPSFALATFWQGGPDNLCSTSTDAGLLLQLERGFPLNMANLQYNSIDLPPPDKPPRPSAMEKHFTSAF